MQKSTLVDEMSKLPKKTHLPVFWYEITVDVDRFSAYKWRASIGMIRFFYLYGHIGWMILGSFILLTMAIRGFNRAALKRTHRLRRQACEDERQLIESTHVDLDNNRLRQNQEVNGYMAPVIDEADESDEDSIVYNDEVE